MAEIKSTMDLVMERAARIGKASSEELMQGEAHKKGMQLAVEFLDSDTSKLAEALESQDTRIQGFVRAGMIDILLRNLFLPRDEVQHGRTEKAAHGLIDLSGGAGDVVSICQELHQILGGYTQHKEQLRSQLEEQIRMQYEQVMAQQGGMQGQDMNIDPTLQPKFREEWSRIDAELTSKYNEALEQHKVQLKQRLGI